MKAYLRSVRIAPKKANIIARMVRGMPVPDAVEALRRTHKKAARLLETLLRSAIANASHNDKQDSQMMVIKTVVVNQGQAHHRGVPMARGRVRPMKKFLSHIHIELGFPEEKKQKKQKNGEQSPLKNAKHHSTPVQHTNTKQAPKKQSSVSSE